MRTISREDLKNLYRPAKDSHKGQNGKLCIIGGSELFHGASLWALKIASRIVDMVYYSSISENNQMAKSLKSEIFDFICVPRLKVKEYINEADAVLIGPGLTRAPATKELTRKLLFQFPDKKWVIDAGSLQMMEKEWLKKLKQAVVTPHQKEFVNLFGPEAKPEQIAKEYGCIVVLKGQTDVICSSKQGVINKTGNEGMTKGGTGDVLAGLIAALACKNDLFLAAQAGVFLNGLAGDQLYKKVGPYYNASDLCDQLAMVMK